jgi:hypothetical protein
MAHFTSQAVWSLKMLQQEAPVIHVTYTLAQHQVAGSVKHEQKIQPTMAHQPIQTNFLMPVARIHTFGKEVLHRSPDEAIEITFCHYICFVKVLCQEDDLFRLCIVLH